MRASSNFIAAAMGVRWGEGRAKLGSSRTTAILRDWARVTPPEQAIWPRSWWQRPGHPPATHRPSSLEMRRGPHPHRGPMGARGHSVLVAVPARSHQHGARSIEDSTAQHRGATHHTPNLGQDWISSIHLFVPLATHQPCPAFT